MESVNVIGNSIQALIYQTVQAIPMIIVALIIWFIGSFLIGLAVKLLRKINIGGTSLDDRAIGLFTTIINVVGRIVLILVILDYFGIGETLIGAVANGLTFTIAIALGLSFGRALEPDAERIVGQLRGFLMQKKEETASRRK